MDNVIIPKDFTEAVADIKLAILQARSEAARTSNKEALKLYFFVGGYISLKTRTARWGTGAICALSKRLQIELPGLRGFSPQHIRFMRQFYEEWNPVLGLANQGCSKNHYLPSSERDYCHLQDGNSILVSKENLMDFLSIGFTHHRSIFVRCKNSMNAGIISVAALANNGLLRCLNII